MLRHNSLRALRLFSVALAAASTLCIASAQTVLRYSPWLPPQHVINADVLKPWSADLERVTSGRVKLEFLPKAVGSPAAQFDVARDGLADFVVVIPSYTSGRFPALDMGEMPLLHSETAVLGPAFYRAYLKHIAASNPFKGTHVLTLFATVPNQIFTRNKVITKPEDLKGLKMRSPGSTGTLSMNALGIIPVQKPVSETYELASTGVIDGTFLSSSAIKDWKLEKSLPKGTLVPGGMGQPVMAFLINEAKWNSISAADRKAIMEIGGEKLSAFASRKYGDNETRARAMLTVAGVTLHDGGPALAAQMKKALAPVEQEWAAKAKKAGMADPLKSLADFRASLQ